MPFLIWNSEVEAYRLPRPSPSHATVLFGSSDRFQKNLIPGEVWHAKFQVIEVTTRSLSHGFKDSSPNRHVL